MDMALALAAAQTGRTAENPAVGCVIVKDDMIIGRGVTADGGRPHGEVMALRDCEIEPAGATVFVTLEPCSHFGKSPPCADALIKARISRCVIAAIDPDPRVNWQGAARLQEAGIDTVAGLRADEARALMSDFFSKFEGQ